MEHANTVGYVNSVETMGALDGPGMRVVVFFQGCAFRCRYCHNPETHAFKTGQQMTAGEGVEKISKYKNYFGHKGGATFSGGEALLQPEFLRSILILCREAGIHTAVDTSGLVDYEAVKDIILLADMLLVDIKHMEDETCRWLTGRGNEQTFKLISFCEEQGKRMWIRHVVSEEFDTLEGIEKLARYADGFTYVERLQLLPLHNLAEEKHFGGEQMKPPSKEFVDKANGIVTKYFHPR